MLARRATTSHHLRTQWIVALIFAMAWPPAALAGIPGTSLPCTPTTDSSVAAVGEMVATIKTGDSFFKFLMRRHGRPSVCTASVRAGESEGWVEFSWPDQAVFKTELMAPEIFVATYSREQGVLHPAEVIAAFRSYAAARGLRVNWNASTVERGANGKIVEFQDETPGLNGIVRLTYTNAGLLVAISLSIAP